MSGGGRRRHDFFVSRRGSVGAVAQEVANVLTDKGYAVLVQDYDIPFSSSFVEAMHEAIKNSRDLIVLFPRDYEASPHTRKEFTSFEAERAQSLEERRVIILRCEDTPLRGLFAANVYQDLVGIDDPEERKRRIIAAAEGHSQAQKPPPRPFEGVPPRIVSFTGRAEALGRLDAILIGGDKPPAISQAGVGRAVVTGLGGVGKTSLAIEYAHRFRDLYAGVWWAPAESRIGLLENLAAFGCKLGLNEEANVEQAAKVALCRLGEQRATWLLVYDNVTEPTEIADLLPSAGARVLITSRFADWSEWAEEVVLDVMPLTEAEAFLEARAGRRDAAGAQILSKALGRLPLALDHAAAYCRSTQMSFTDYAAKAEKFILEAPRRGVAYLRSVGATFALAITEAVRHCPAAEPLMGYLAYCAPDRIPMALVEGAIVDDAERLEAIAALAEVSLLRHDPFEDGAPAVTVHRLVQAAARKAKEKEKEKEKARASIDRLMDRLAAIYPLDGYENPKSWALCARLTPHLLPLDKAAPTSAAESTQWSGLLTRVGNFFLGRGANAQARPLFERALGIDEKVLGADEPDTLRTKSNIARWTARSGNPRQALRLFKELLPDQERVLGPRDPETLRTRGSVAFWTGMCGDPRQALGLLKDLLPDQEGVLGPRDRDTLRTRGGIAHWTGECENAPEALLLYQALLPDRREALGPDHKDTLRTRNNIAGWTGECGNPRQALRLFKDLLPDRERVLGPRHPETLRTRGNIAAMTGYARQALRLFKELLPDQERVLGPDHPDTLTTRGNIAALTNRPGDAKAALRLFWD